MGESRKWNWRNRRFKKGIQKDGRWQNKKLANDVGYECKVSQGEKEGDSSSIKNQDQLKICNTIRSNSMHARN